MVSFVRANPRLFGDKPEDGPDYKEDLDRTNDLEAMAICVAMFIIILFYYNFILRNFIFFIE